jgi:uncharacterized protein
MINVVLDTNAVLFPFQFKVSLEDEIRQLVGGCTIFVPEIVREELEGLRKRGIREAGAGLRYAERFETFSGATSIHDGGDEEIIGGRGDAGVLEASMKLEAILVTSDRGLIARAKEQGLKVIFLRGKQKLVLK